MYTFHLVLVSCLLIVGVVSGQSIQRAENVLNFDSLTPQWQELLTTLHAVQNVEARFEEARYFKFKTQPQQYTGVFRKASNGAVSLAYEDGSSMALHVGEGYAYYRKGDGEPKAIPDFASKRDSVSLLPSLLGLQLASLDSVYQIYGEVDGTGWALRLVERDDADAELTYEQIDISGSGAMVQTIELRKGAMRSVEIHMQAAEFPAEFSPEIKERFFFQP